VRTADDDGAAVTGTVTQDPTDWFLDDPEGTFVDDAVEAGDEVRVAFTTDGFGNEAYTSLVVDAVITNQRLRLVAGPDSAITLESKYEIHRPQDVAAQAADFGARALSLGDRRVRVPFPANPTKNDVVVPNYHLAAALAGLRSGVFPHQPLSNVELRAAGWAALESAETFSDQLENLLNDGVWVVTQDLASAGVPSSEVVTFRQGTTDVASDDLRNIEDSIVANADSIALTMLNAASGRTGKVNIFPGQLENLGLFLNAVLEELGIVVNDDIGPQVITFERTGIRQLETQRDKVVVDYDLTVPSPLNELEINLTIVV